MATNNKKGYELDLGLERIIIDVFSEYIPFITVGGSLESNISFYTRKMNEYIEKIKTRAREETNKKDYELDARLVKIIIDVFSDYIQYITICGSVDSNRAFYIRKMNEYIDQIRVKAKEELSENNERNYTTDTGK